MKTLFKSVAAVTLMLGAASIQPAMAQSSGTVVQGLAIANLEAVIVNTSAYKVAEQQRPVTYKPQIDQAEARRVQLQAQLKPLVDKFTADRQAASPNQQALAQQAGTIQQLQTKGQQELQTILQPVALSSAFVSEQIEGMLDQAIKAAMAKKKVSLLLRNETVLAMNSNAYNLNQDILNELNKLLPAAQLVPPQGWEPRQVREAKAAQAGASGQQAASTSTQPQGR
ncbi:MAG: OmpH family outer membrane protein [Sphingomonadaceae bacterium]|nr:OmpH family outer membrane protein [Sphingomonadaceae bacterium]